MSGFIKLLRRFQRASSGATAVEFALVCLPLLLLSLGVIEFGRALFVKNEIAYAADIAARKVLIGQIPAGLSDSETTTQLETAIREAFDSGEAALLEISVVRQMINGTEYRILSIQYPFSLLVPGLNGNTYTLQLNRRIPFA